MTNVWAAAGLAALVWLGAPERPHDFVRSPLTLSPTLSAVVAVPSVCSAAVASAAVSDEEAPPLEAPEYYGFELVPTGTVPGTGMVQGEAQVHFANTPFGIAIAHDGSYVYDVSMQVDRLTTSTGVPTVWFAKSDLSEIERAGVLGPDGSFAGRVRWNKFLAIVTLEPADDAGATVWQGPILMRGMSRSGMMHTMAGHGPFQVENCAAYGYR